MLRNYPLKTVIGFMIWFAIAIAACQINYPIVRILAYTSLIFFGVLQGWSIKETYMQELENRNSSAFLTPDKSKQLRVAIYIMLTASIVLGSWAVTFDGVSVPLLIAIALDAGIFAAFRLDKVHELQTAREICSASAVIFLIFIIMLPLYYKLNLIAPIIVALGLYLSAIGVNIVPQKMPRLTLGDFQKIETLGGLPAEKAFEWYGVYPYTTVACRKGRKIIGFINMFPLKDEPASKLRKGALKAGSLDIGDIGSLAVIDPSRKKSMFLASIAATEDLSEATLIKEALSQYEDYADCFNKVYIDAVTDNLERLAKEYGFTFLGRTEHDSDIYEINFNTLI